jgi:Xaa-Pro aminopeptidase
VTDYAARMNRAATAAASAGLAGVFAAPGPDLQYLIGYAPVDPAERLLMLLVRPDHDPVLVLPAFENADAPVTIVRWSDGEDPYAKTGALLEPGRYAISDACWALHALGLRDAMPQSTLVSMSAALPLLRAVKDADELDRMAAAGAAVDAAFEDILRVPFAGRTELDIAAELDRLLREHGHERVEFTLVGSGPGGAEGHHDAGERVIEDGDLVVLDFGGFVDGYGSDTTRTVHVGEPTAEHAEVYEIVRAAQEAAVAAVRPGIACEDVDRAAREHITAAGYGEFFNHRTGHGIGLETHEQPYIVTGNAQPLQPGMCFSVEPGIYLPGRFGVRIEDIVAVTESGARRLNASTHELQTVG